MTKALLLVDIQSDYFEGGAFPLPAMAQAAQKAVKVLACARNNGWKIIHIRHEQTDPDAGFLLAGTPGSQIHEAVAPRADEDVIVKHHPNSFLETDLKQKLAGIKEVVIVGAMSNMCIDATARSAADLGFVVTIVEDACAASGLEFRGRRHDAAVVHDSFMAALASAYGEVVGTEQLIRGS